MPSSWPGEGWRTRCLRALPRGPRGGRFPGLGWLGSGRAVLRNPSRLPLFSPPTPLQLFLKANVNPWNRLASQEIHIMYSKALHPNSFKILH